MYRDIIKKKKIKEKMWCKYLDSEIKATHFGCYHLKKARNKVGQGTQQYKRYQ